MKQVWEFVFIITEMSSPLNFVVKRLSHLYGAYVHKLISVIAYNYRKGRPIDDIDDMKMFIEFE